tara:strand:- start:64941 stop:66980 length:2040 start_codon:yes stop_codon:yes gene_type:complete
MSKIRKELFIILIVFSLSNIFSQSLKEFEEMKSEFETMKKNQSSIGLQQSVSTTIDPMTGRPMTTQLIPYSPLKKDSSATDLYYGYDFFTKRDTVSFWESLPAPANYLLGPGDELVISLWGETQLRQTYIISRDGKIYDEKVGLLNVTGKSINDLEKHLIDQFGRIYSTIKGSKPSTFLDVSLGQLRSINVNFVGEITYPGVYPIHPFSTVITGLIQAGGVDTTGSLRNIQIIREGNLFSNVDLYDYLLKGSLPKKIQLRDNDIVLIPVRKSSVKIDSAVIRPGVYEAQPGETLKQLLNYAGGLKPNASKTISLERITPIEERNKINLPINNYFIEYNNSNLFIVENGDKIKVRYMFDVLQKVEIIGQIKSPGQYSYFPGMVLSDLVELGGGFRDSTFLKSIYTQRGELVRRNPDARYETVIELSLKNIYGENGIGKMKLQNLDRFVVHANPNYFEKENIKIIGEVNIPGSYPLISDNETLSSLLYRAGGVTSKALPDGIAIYRDKKYFDIDNYEKEINQPDENPTDNIENNFEVQDREKGTDLDKVRVSWNNKSLIIMPGDSIVIKEITGTVNIAGEVYNPGLVEFHNNKSLRYYLNAGGGITERGNKKGIVVIYPNGVVNPKKWFSSPKIKDGSTIIVNPKKDQEPLDITAFAANWTSIISSMVSLVILTQQINSNN